MTQLEALFPSKVTPLEYALGYKTEPIIINPLIDGTDIKPMADAVNPKTEPFAFTMPSDKNRIEYFAFPENDGCIILWRSPSIEQYTRGRDKVACLTVQYGDLVFLHTAKMIGKVKVTIDKVRIFLNSL